MLLVTNFADSRPSHSNQLLLESIGDGTYVSAMQLADCHMTLRFKMPSHPLKQVARAVPSVATSGQQRSRRTVLFSLYPTRFLSVSGQLIPSVHSLTFFCTSCRFP